MRALDLDPLSEPIEQHEPRLWLMQEEDDYDGSRVFEGVASAAFITLLLFLLAAGIILYALR